MIALSPAFEVMDWVAGLSLNHRKCCLMHYVNDNCHELLEWVSTRCEEFCEMKIKYAKYVGTLIGTEGYHHRWIAPRKILSKNEENQRNLQEPRSTTG